MLPLLPIPTSYDFGNRGSINPIFLSQKFLCDTARIVMLFYQSHLRPRQYVPRIILAASPPAFSHHIVRIFSKCSKKQMRRIYANRIVAFMQNILTFWDRSIVYQVTSAMRSNIARRFRTPSHGTVTATGFSTNPNPARRAFFNFGKKSLLNCDGQPLGVKDGIFMKLDRARSALAFLNDIGNLVLHRSVSLIYAALSDAVTSREQFAFKGGRSAL